jgi:hypothetical protein
VLTVCGKQIVVRGVLVRVALLDGEGFQFFEEPEQAVKGLLKSGQRIDLFTFIQRISESHPKYGLPVEWDNMAVLPVSSFDHWISKQINFKVRNKVRKAIKAGVVTREVPLDDALIQGISAIYNESPVRQGKKFRHYRKDLESLRRMKETFLERSIFIGAYFEESLIGFAKLVTDETQSQAGLMHIFSMIGHRDKAPANALIAQSVRSCAERRISHLWYANMSYGKKQADSLAEFKRHNGFQKVDVPRYYVPLTRTGRLALRLGLHHGIADWVPEPMAAAYRKVRTLWYSRRFSRLQNA